MSSRGAYENERVTLSFGPRLPGDDEAAVFMKLVEELRPMLPGAVAYAGTRAIGEGAVRYFEARASAPA